MKRHISFFIISFVFSLFANAYKVQIDGIYYQLIDSLVPLDDEYSGCVCAVKGNLQFVDSLFIPSEVEYDGKKYYVLSIGDSAFENCDNLKYISISEGIILIGRKAFYGCSNLSEITLPSSLVNIKMLAFYGCHAIVNIHIPKIENWCKVSQECGMPRHWNLYINDSLIVELNIPNTVKEIPNSAFEGCNSLISVVIPESVVSIGDWAFGHCYNLSYIDVSNSVSKVARTAFNYTLWYEELAEEVIYVGSVLHGYKGTMPSHTSIVVKEGTKGISEGALEYQRGLTSITIPNSVTYIGDEAFRGCENLESIHLLSNVDSIGNRGFYNCPKLTKIIIDNRVEHIGEQVFYSLMPKEDTLYVPLTDILYYKKILNNSCSKIFPFIFLSKDKASILKIIELSIIIILVIVVFYILIKMKSYLSCLFLVLATINVSCVSKEKDPTRIVEESKNEATVKIDIIDGSQFICFKPEGCTLEYIVNTPPQKTDSTILFCVAASFTGQRMESFEYSNICGTYIADSRVWNKDIQPTINIDASFAYWNDSSYFSKGKNVTLLESAIKNNGVFFMQKHVLCDGERGQMNLTRSTIYRVLAKYNDKLCVIQNTQPMEYMPFVQGLENLGIKDAIYLDMGGWRYSWYRDEEGKVIELFPVTNDTKYQTNWIIFRTKKK